MSYTYLTVYVIAWTITFIIFQYSRRTFEAGSFLLLLYLIFSVASLILFSLRIYEFHNIRPFPFIYLFLLLLMTAWPILRYNTKKISEIQKPNGVLLNAVSVLFIVSTLFYFPSIIVDFSINIAKLLSDPDAGKDLYLETWTDNYSGVTKRGGPNFAALISGSLSGIAILLAFYNLTLIRRNNLITFGLFLCSFIIILPSISRGQRNGITETLLVFIITYFSLRKFIPYRINRIIRLIALILIPVLVIPLIILTNSRFATSAAGSQGSTFFYIGQQNLYFNNYAFDNNGIRYGDRTVPLFKRMLGFDDVPSNYWERRFKYRNLRINDEVFIGHIGDIVLDFGPVTSVLIVSFFTLYILRKTKVTRGRILFHQLILLHIVLYLCVIGGLKLFPFADTGGNLRLMTYILFYIIFRLDYRMNHYNKKIPI